MVIRNAILTVALLAAPAAADETVLPRSVYGTNALTPGAVRVLQSDPGVIRVEGFVTKARRFPKRHHVALEMDGPRKGRGEPPFVAFVRGENLLAITGQPTGPDAKDWLRSLIGKLVRVEGKVELYKGRPQIVVTEKRQMEVLD